MCIFGIFNSSTSAFEVRLLQVNCLRCFSCCFASFYVCSFNWHQHAVSCNAVEAQSLSKTSTSLSTSLSFSCSVQVPGPGLRLRSSLSFPPIRRSAAVIAFSLRLPSSMSLVFVVLCSLFSVL